MRRSGSSVRMLGSVFGVVLLALAIAAVSTLGLGFLLSGWHFWREPVPRPAGDGSLTDPVKIALTIVAGVGGVVALVVSYRKQAMAERVENRDRYGAAVTQLGNPDPTVRLAGVYAMANLADEWKAQRQQCVEVLCAYLRMPWDPDAESQHPLAVRKVEARHGARVTTLTYRDPHGDRQVRGTILRIIGDHLRGRIRHARPVGGPFPWLRPVRGGLWSRLSFDLTGAALLEVDMSGTFWLGDRNLFERATFLGESTIFKGAVFSGVTKFDRATFTARTTAFDKATALGERISFAGAIFSGRLTSFDEATFTSRSTFFLGATFSGQWISFFEATFSGPGTRFDETTFSGWTSFSGAVFSGRAVFDNATFSGKSTTFEGASFSGASTSFYRAKFSSESTKFGAKFSGRATFDKANFSGQRTRLDGATLTGESTSFDGATFSGEVEGKARFKGSRSEVFGKASIDPEVLDLWVFDTPEVVPVPVEATVSLDRPTDRPTDQPTNRPTDQPTD